MQKLLQDFYIKGVGGFFMGLYYRVNRINKNFLLILSEPLLKYFKIMSLASVHVLQGQL
jgi:hypothetical protein